MNVDWPRVKISEVCELIVDCVNKTAPRVDYETPYKMIRTPNVKDGRVDITNCRFVEEDTYKKWTRRAKVLRGDVLLTREAPMGQVGYVDFDDTAFLGQRIMQYRVNSEVLDSRYLLYAFLSTDLQHQFHMHEGSGSVVSHIRVPDCLKFELTLPPINEQKRVAKILADLDDKIELNRQTNQTLEQIAQALFKSWFVDFEPTRAKLKAKQEWAKLNPTTKAAGNDQNAETLFVERAAMAAISGKALHELDHLDSEQLAQLKLTAGLFPDGFEESELGEVPVGWEVGELQCIAEFSTDRISVSELTLNNYISTENMLERKQGVSFATSLPSVKTVPHFSANQILISNIRPYFMKIWLTRFEGGRSNDVLGIKARDTGSVEYLYNLLYQDSFFGFMMTTSKGAKMPRGDKKAIMGWMCVHPPKEVKRMYSLAVDKFYQIIDSANKENENLKNIRNTLLPKLLSGELSLEQFQTELETA